MIDHPELLSFLGEEESRARDATLDDQRAALLSFYNGDPYGDEEDGRSQLVTRDVAEVVDHMTVSVLRTMVSGDKVVEFEDSDDNGPAEPMQAPDPQQPQGPRKNPIGPAQQATEAIHYYFMRKSHGYRVLHDALKAGNLEKTGWVKVYPERQQPKRAEHIVPAEMLGEVQALEAEPIDPANEMGDWRVAVAQQQPVKFCVLNVPNEEILVSPDTRDLNDPPYIAQKSAKTLSELRQMGFEAEGLSDESSGIHEQLLSVARDADREYDDRLGIERGGANRRVWLLEEYARFDLNGDGIAEYLCIHRVGTKILSVEECDEHPFEYWCPFPMQHRLVGQSLADKVADIQRTNSVLLRNAMDSLYIGLAPRTFVNESAIGTSTLDDLLTVRPNGIVRWKGNIKPETLANQDTSGTAFQAIEFMIGQRESRTGITRLNQGLDADALNKTATGTALMQAQGQQIEEYVARNFAEMLVAPLFAKMYRQMRKHGSPFNMKIDGQSVVVDPRQWPEEIDINIRVGLGSGRKEQRLIYRMQLLSIQQQAMMAGLPTVTAEHIYNSVSGLVEDCALGDPNDYMADPALLPPAEPKPDPAMAKTQGELQLAAQKQQHDQQMAEAAHGLKAQGAQVDAQIKGAKAQQDADLAHQKAEFEADLANRKMAAEMAMNQQRLEAQMELDRQAHEHSMALAQMKLSQDRPGGALDA